MKQKLLFLDVETTGLDPRVHDVISMAGLVWVDGEEVHRFSRRFRPHDGTSCSREALDLHKLTVEELRSWPDPNAEFRELVEQDLSPWCDRYKREDKLHLVAYNAIFDSQHVRAWMQRCGSDFYGAWFWHPPLCLMTTAALALRDVRNEMRNFKLRSVCKALGVKVEETETHSAWVDIHATRDLYLRLAPAVMRLDEIRAAATSSRRVRTMPRPEGVA